MSRQSNPEYLITTLYCRLSYDDSYSGTNFQRLIFQRMREENRKRLFEKGLANAPTTHKKVKFHSTFGALGLSFSLFILLTVKDGQFIFVTQGIFKALFPLLVSIASGVTYRLLLRGISYRHYKNNIEGHESTGYIDKKLKRAIDIDDLILTKVVALSWLLFVFGAGLLFVGLIEFLSA